MIENPVRTEEVINCLLCGSDNAQHKRFAEHEGDAGVDRYMLCERCGLVFQSPRLSQEDLEAFYSDAYRVLVQGSAEPTEKDLRIQKARARNLLDFVKDHCVHVANCLDIGSSSGIMLQTFKSHYGCEVMGIEPGDDYRKFSQESGIPAAASVEELESTYRNSFDLITMAHTLEHLSDPLPYLRNLHENWLTEKGCLLIEVPNLYGHTSFELAHLTAFTKATLSMVLQQAGFKLLKIRSHGDPRSLLIPLYITVLAVRADEEIAEQVLRTSYNWVAIRRKFGMFWNSFASRYLTRWAWLPWPNVE